MRVGELRKLLEGVSPDMVVLLRGDEIGILGITHAGPDCGCTETYDFFLEAAVVPSEVVTCAICGGPAACIGAYEGRSVEEFACDNCCAHGNEDGHCRPIDPAEFPPNESTATETPATGGTTK
jgi:hypothetical protein